MDKTTVTLLGSGGTTLVVGVGLLSIPAAVILAGLILLTLGVLSIKLPDPKESRP